MNHSDPFGLCKKPRGLKKGEIGICIESFIAGPSAGVPRWAADNRTFSASRGTYKTSDRFIVHRRTGAVRNDAGGVGRTGPFRGLGSANHSAVSGEAGTVISAGGFGRTASPWPPAGIDYAFELSGGVSLTDYAHDGFPSFEIWIYEEGKVPRLLYGYTEGNVMQLRPPMDVREPEQ